MLANFQKSSIESLSTFYCGNIKNSIEYMIKDCADSETEVFKLVFNMTNKTFASSIEELKVFSQSEETRASYDLLFSIASNCCKNFDENDLGVKIKEIINPITDEVREIVKDIFVTNINEFLKTKKSELYDELSKTLPSSSITTVHAGSLKGLSQIKSF